MQSRTQQSTAALAFALLITGVVGQPASAKIIRFSAPGAIYTDPIAMNDSGSIIGDYTDASNGNHAFLRTPDGTVTSIDVPNSGCGTTVTGITNGGVIVGYGGDDKCSLFGFIRTPDGQFATFVVDGAQSTEVRGINSAGDIIGIYYDTSQHGFLRAVDGSVTKFDPHGALYTVPVGINKRGEIVGQYGDKNHVIHGFIRSVRGKITSFDVPGAGETYLEAINDAGEICGGYYSVSDGGTKAFRRKVDGTIEMLALPDNTSAYAINREGAATGFSTNLGLPLGFIWESDGTVKTIEPKNSLGVMPSAIDNKGAISGQIENGNETYEAFVRSP